MILRVSPIAANITIEPNTASGIEVAIMIVERQLPRNKRIMTLVRIAAITPSRTTPAIAPLTNSPWSPTKPTTSVSGSESLKATTFFLMPSMISSVEM